MELLQSKETIDLDFKAFLDLSSLEELAHLQVQGPVSFLQQFLSPLPILSQPLEFLLEGVQLLRKGSVHWFNYRKWNWNKIILGIIMKRRRSFGPFQLKLRICCWDVEDVSWLESFSTWWFHFLYLCSVIEEEPPNNKGYMLLLLFFCYIDLNLNWFRRLTDTFFLSYCMVHLFPWHIYFLFRFGNWKPTTKLKKQNLDQLRYNCIIDFYKYNGDPVLKDRNSFGIFYQSVNTKS